MEPAANPLESILAAAVEIGSADERRAFVEQACAGDAELQRRVLQMIADHFQAGSFLEPAQLPSARLGPQESGGPTLDQPALETPGAMIGPYKLMEQIGEGGFGLVFVAEQTHPVRRKVALKVIKPGMDTRQVIARFEAERQALALMEHPNIAKVLDAGATAGGRPYFVMELVKGVPITQYCDENRRTPRQRLELFVDVCSAVQHAHQKGIIHRDLKPSNVLVTSHDGKPVVKVIDFGIAKAIGQQLTDKTVYTQLAQLIGTPLYMSPEQAGQSGLDVDTRSDIYSLGVLLYELLTGTTPFSKERFQQAAYDEIRRIIREEEPPKPSTRLSELSRSGEPSRTGGAAGSARLAEPTSSLASVSAMRQTEPAKLTKLVRGELDWIVMKTLEKDRNRRYETANGLAMDVLRYLADEPVQACPPSVGYRFRKFARRNKRTLVTAALIGVVLLAAVGAVTGTVGWAVRDREAREQDLALKAERDLVLTEQGVRQAVEQAAKIRSELHAVLTKPGGVQELLNQPGRWNFLIHSAQSELAQARRAMARAETRLSAELTLALHKAEEQLNRDETDRLLALRLEKIRLDQTTWVEDRFDKRKAAAEYPQAFAEFAVLKDDAAAVAARIRSSPINEQLVAALDDWAFVAMYPVSERLEEKLLAVARLAAPDPTWADRMRQLKGWRDQEALGKLVEEAPVTRLSPQMLALVGNLLSFQKSSLQESWLRRAQAQYPADFWLNFNLAHALQKTQALEATGFYRVALAVRPTSSAAYNNLGNALSNLKRLPEAIAAYHKAIEIDPNLAQAHNSLGIALYYQKKVPEAVAAFKKAIELDPKCAAAHTSLGNVLYYQKKLPEAVAAFKKAIELDPNYASAHNHLGGALGDQKQLDEAIACFRKAIELDPKDASAHNNLGLALSGQKKLDEAIASYHKAIEIDPKLANAYGNLGLALYGQKKLDDAIACFKKAIELDPKLAMAHNNLGLVLRDQKKLDEAIACYKRAIELDPKLAPAHYNLGLTLKAQGKLDEAIAAVKEAVELAPKSGNYWSTLGVAHYRAGNWKAATEALDKSMELRKGGDGFDWFFLAMAHWQLGDKRAARKWHAQAVEWTDKNRPRDEILRRIRAEATELLGIEKKKD